LSAFLAILPFVEEGLIEGNFNYQYRIYDVASNWDVAAMQIPMYVCPSDDSKGRRLIVYNRARSNYALNFGTGTWVPSGVPWDPDVYYCKKMGSILDTDGAFRIQAPKGFKKFLDGTSKTALVSELIAGKKDAGDCYSWSTCDHRGAWVYGYMGFSLYSHRNTPNTSIGDALSPYKCVHTPPLLPCENSPALERQWENTHVAARSMHPGGVNVLYADGHVEFTSETSDLLAWRAISTIAGGEVVQAP
jgi:prepilin-type processing-associated H-X9-DG protein